VVCSKVVAIEIDANAILPHCEKAVMPQRVSLSAPMIGSGQISPAAIDGAAAR